MAACVAGLADIGVADINAILVYRQMKGDERGWSYHAMKM